MIGGADDAVARLAPIFDALAPGVDVAERTPTRVRSGDPGHAPSAAGCTAARAVPGTS